MRTWCCLTWLVLQTGILGAADEDRTPTERAIAYLRTEVPSWPRENPCFSCHNNGDAARALYAAAERGYPDLVDPLADTTRWLSQPPEWRNNGGDQRVSDQRLATLQFSFALQAAVKAKQVPKSDSLRAAAEILLEMQDEDGSWPIGVAGSRGSPATYGATLATWVARRTLLAGGQAVDSDSVRKAERWLLQRKPKNVFDAAASLLALRDLNRPKSDPAVEHALSLVQRGEYETGGWGPYVNAYPEPFDTALVLLALTAWQDRVEVQDAVRRGRQYLHRIQLKDGGWPETTRPAGNVSYAEHISTTAWVTLALLETDDPSGGQ